MSSEAQPTKTDDISISVVNLGKTYRLFDHPGDRIKQFLSCGVKQYHREFTALEDVSFDIKKGETVGIIGLNGSGKSTLLQLICGILKPTTGAVTVNGRICALLELGAGFNPEFTGRENIFFQGALIGLSKAQVDERIDRILEFADIGNFIDQPVRTYSSGMFMRLAFSSAINFEPNILIIDEALAVGDSAFQAKCLIHLKALQAKNDSIILFVSHDMVAVQNLCTRVLTLKQGHLVHDDQPHQVIEWPEVEHELPTMRYFPANHPLRRGSQAYASLKSINVMDAFMVPATRFAMGDCIIIDLEFECHQDLPGGRFGIIFSNPSGHILHDFASGFSGIVGLIAGINRFRITTGPILAYPGHYQLGAWIQHSKGIPSDDYFAPALTMEIVDKGKVGHHEANFSGIRSSQTETYLPCSIEKMQ